MKSLPRVTQRDIAIQAGVTQSAVSLALRDHPSIPVDTRRRIKQIMAKLGYRPDPYLSGLAAYRQQNRSPSYHATLAWLSNFPEKGGWRYWPVFVGYYEGAVKRAAELGYKLEEYCPRADGFSRERLEQVLKARNISGILLPPQPAPMLQMDLSWEKFSAVTFGYSLIQPQLHLVTLHHFRCMEIAFRRILALGYKRPGLALSEESDRRADNMLSAAFWSEQRSLPATNRIPMLQPADLDPAGVLAWYYRYKPDAILAIRPEVYQWLTDAGVNVPGEVGIGMLSIPNESSIFSGIWENPVLAGAKALEMLVAMIHHGERGVPEIPVRTMIEGTWKPGKTLRKEG